MSGQDGQMSAEDARALVKPTVGAEEDLTGFDPEDNYDDSDGLWDDAEEIMRAEGQHVSDGATPAVEEEPVAEGESTSDWREIAEQLRIENEELRRAEDERKKQEFQKYLESLETPEERYKAELEHERDLRRQTELRAAMRDMQTAAPMASSAYEIFAKHFDLEVPDASALAQAIRAMEQEFAAIFGAIDQRREEEVMSQVKRAWGVDTGLHQTKPKSPNPRGAAEERLRKAQEEMRRSGGHPDAVARFLRERRRIAQEQAS